MSDVQVKKNTKGLIQTAVFLCFLLIFPVFSLAMYLYSQTSMGLSVIIEKSFSVSIGVFGGVATLTAAYIASLLFNDWRVQHNKQILATEAKDAFNVFHKQRDFLNEFMHLNEKIISGKDIAKRSLDNVANQYERDFLIQYKKDIDQMAAFCFLSEGNLLHDLTSNYFEAIEVLTKHLSKKVNNTNSGYIYLDKELSSELLELIQHTYNRNFDVLQELKTYIFIPIENK